MRGEASRSRAECLRVRPWTVADDVEPADTRLAGDGFGATALRIPFASLNAANPSTEYGLTTRAVYGRSFAFATVIHRAMGARLLAANLTRARSTTRGLKPSPVTARCNATYDCRRTRSAATLSSDLTKTFDAAPRQSFVSHKANRGA